LSLEHVAKSLEKHGRKGDTMLMHVNPTELQVLESMLGKTTVNPTTGLPEAFSWKKLLAGLGVVGAGALTAFTGGAAAPLLAPALAAAGIGTSISSIFDKGKKKSTASEAGEYLDKRNEQRVADQYKFAPATYLRSISDKVYDANNPRTNLLGVPMNWLQAPVEPEIPKMGTGMAKGGQVTEAQAKETVLAMLAKMQQQQPKAMAQGRRVQGPGTGLDDSIPARLSVGEYVIPADVVSMMGDGSTEAGGKRLDDLLKMVRMQKTGTKKQAKPLRMGRL
jgi:hypothetical protein